MGDTPLCVRCGAADVVKLGETENSAWFEWRQCNDVWYIPRETGDRLRLLSVGVLGAVVPFFGGTVRVALPVPAEWHR